ncbi:MAG: hypoxanthine phosphoribosyltransferase [Verrucomicrobia bacterium]|nr:hypoxanthine phosphoribosyltransferase [Verrucomicrobiota bacterium]
MLRDLDRVLYHESTILVRLDELAAQITKEYRDLELTVVAVLNGSFMFMGDLLRRIPLPLRVDCVSVASYHGGTETTGKVTFDQLSIPDVKGRHVLILDDILDSGLTMDAIKHKLGGLGAKSIKVCVLLRKLKKRMAEVDAEYVGFDIGDEFVVGYGLDFQEKYRNLPCIGVLLPEVIEAGFAAARAAKDKE